ncbi:MAG: cobalt-precorrin 5A hydrolase [Desulfobacteraceae bacterium]|nr:cobalt-precorrin 5A hydrolase [Desulfobacteraceae bacterium]
MVTETLQNNSSPCIAVWAITPNGLTLGQDICAKISGARLFVAEQLTTNSIPELSGREIEVLTFKKLSEELLLQFTRFSSHIFIFSTGIAVRMLAPLIKSKTTDPGVVVVDDKGIHAISLLSGHLGGANQLAQKIATLINARAVVTTATDINNLPSIDMLAQENNLQIENPGAIKHVNMVFLKKGTMDVYDPTGYIRKLIPKEFICNHGIPKQGPGIVCTWETIKVPRETIVLRPKILSVGIGCNRNTSLEIIHEFLKAVFTGEGLSLNSVFSLATTEVKKDEEGLLSLADKLNLPLTLYDKNQLNSVDTIETPSKMVEKHLGVKSVCEAAAILAAERGRLIVSKKKNKDVTIAVAIKG